jgi:hypothetical protein
MSAGRTRELGQAGLRAQARREAAAHQGGKKIFPFSFSLNSQTFTILSNKKVFSQVDPKTKFVLKIVIFNFAKRSKVKIPIDFEIRT